MALRKPPGRPGSSHRRSSVWVEPDSARPGVDLAAPSSLQAGNCWWDGQVGWAGITAERRVRTAAHAEDSFSLCPFQKKEHVL